MPPFLNPLPPDESRTEKRKLHELGHRENPSNKRQATGTILPSALGSGTQYWMVQWYAFPATCLAIIYVTVLKEGASIEETQDMGGRWYPRRDQAERCSYGPGRPRVCVYFLFVFFCSKDDIGAIALQLVALAPERLKKVLS
jgi:hypothetical protein